MTEYPTGTVTFLLTDLEKSTQQWERHPEEMTRALSRHDALLRDAILSHQGILVKTTGDGALAAFDVAADAVEAAIAAQRAFRAEPWEEETPIRVRIGIHSGAAELREEDYFGPTLNRTARLMSAGHGGQILLSQSTQELAQDDVPEGAEFLDLGRHRLKDLIRPEQIYQLNFPGLDDEFPAILTLDSRPNNLPPQSTPFLNREPELKAVMALMNRSEVRLLTLTGVGGTGKTRLSLQVAAELLDDFEDGVFFISLAATRDADRVPHAVADALNLRESEGEPLEDRIVDELRDKHLLLVFDNFEQIIEAGPFVTMLLSAAPHLKALVTSRSALRVSGEHEYPVPTLPVPDYRKPSTPERFSQYTAVQLFIERAQAVKADFTVTTENAPAVAEICCRLDGLPLAIELAAARIRLLSPQAMLPRLENRLSLLTGGARDLPARQQTLRNAIAWSYDLLDDGEKQLFRRLSVFSGGFSVEAAESVAAGSDLDVFEGLDSLVEESLIRAEETEGEPRFLMLQTLKEFAGDELEESGEEAAIRERHAIFLTDWIPSLPEEDRLDGIDRELDNVRAALEWGKRSPDKVELGIKLLDAMGWYWWLRGEYAEGRRHMEEFAAANGISLRSRAHTLQGAGYLAGCQGQADASVRLLEESVRQFRENHDSDGMSWALQMLGASYSQRGDGESARRVYEEALGLFQEANQDNGIAWVQYSLGLLALEAKEYDRAQDMLLESLAIFRRIPDEGGIQSSLQNLGEVAAQSGESLLAVPLFREALSFAREMQSVASILESLCRIAEMELIQINFPAVRSALREGWTLGETLEDPQPRLRLLRVGIEFAMVQNQSEKAARLLGTLETMTAASPVATPPPLNLLPSSHRFQNDLESQYPKEASEGAGMSLEEIGILLNGL